MGQWFARAIVEQQLQNRANNVTQWRPCSVCHAPLHSKGFAKRRILTLVGWVEWQRRVGRCRHHCSGSQTIPFDEVLGIAAYQQTSTELVRLGCLLAVFLPFEVAARMLQQLVGVPVSHDTVWHWVQRAGQKAIAQLNSQLQDLATGHSLQLESLDAMSNGNAVAHCGGWRYGSVSVFVKNTKRKDYLERDQGRIARSIRETFNDIWQPNHAPPPTTICSSARRY